VLIQALKRRAAGLFEHRQNDRRMRGDHGVTPDRPAMMSRQFHRVYVEPHAFKHAL